MTNDTQAPERIWLIPAIGGTLNDELVMASPHQVEIGLPYTLSTLAAAQTAAAVERAFRDGLAYATNTHLFKRTQFDQAWEQSKARERLGDASAALDALIAERVREARLAAFEEAEPVLIALNADGDMRASLKAGEAWPIGDLIRVLTEWQEADPARVVQATILRPMKDVIAARASKEGR